MACTNSLRIFFPAIAIALASTFAYAQSAPSNPAMTYGMVPTVGQWNNWFQQKQDTLGFTPLNQAGGTMLGELKTAPSTASAPGFAILPGIAPNVPDNGDIWLTSSGLYYRAGNITFGPIGAGTITGPSTTTTNNVAIWGNTGGTSLLDSGKSLPSGAIVGTTDTQTLTNKSIDAAQINSGTLPASRLSGAYPSVTQINDTLFGNAGSNPYIGANGNFPLSFQSNGKEFLRGFDAGSGNMRVWMNQNADTSIAPWFNLGDFVVAAPDTHNSFVAMATNNSPPGTVAFPTAVTGIAYTQSNGKTAIGMYAEGHAAAQGTVPATEFAGFQDGAPAITTYPFDNSIGTTQTTAKSIQATAGTLTAVTVTGTTTSASTSVTGLSSTTGLYVGMFVSGTGVPANTSISSINTGASSIVLSHPATASGTVSLVSKSPAGVALEIGPEGATSGSFQYGIAVNSAAVRQFSYWQDGQGDIAPQSGMYMAYAGSGIGIRLRAVGTSSFNQNGNFAMLQLDSALTGTGVMSVRQNGQGFFGNSSSTGSMLTLQNTAGTCTLTPTSTTASFVCSSDERLKKNITDARSALDWVRSFRVREYDLKSTGDHLTGVIAQEVQKTHPDMVHTQDSGMLAVDGPNPWVLIKAMQEQLSKIQMVEIWNVVLTLLVAGLVGDRVLRRRLA